MTLKKKKLGLISMFHLKPQNASSQPWVRPSPSLDQLGKRRVKGIGGVDGDMGKKGRIQQPRIRKDISLTEGTKVLEGQSDGSGVAEAVKQPHRPQ